MKLGWTVGLLSQIGSLNQKIKGLKVQLCANNQVNTNRTTNHIHRKKRKVGIIVKGKLESGMNRKVVCEWMNEWMNEWVNGWMKGWMNEWMNE